MSWLITVILCRRNKHPRRERFGAYSDKCLDCGAVIAR